MKSTTQIQLPDALARYFDAANRHEPKAAALCFTANAVVHDEGYEHRGHCAILGWVTNTSRRYKPHFEVTHAEATDSSVTVSVRVSGTFPGSPVELDYAIGLREGKISSLRIE